MFVTITFFFTLFSCHDRKIIYSGFNDLVVGSQSFMLYDDSTFYIEMGMGSAEGSYTMEKDKVYLKYIEKPSLNWPDIIFIRKDYFIVSDSLDNERSLKIFRNK